MQRGTALPFEAFKFKGAQRTRSPDTDTNAPTTSPQTMKTKPTSPALPPLAATSPPINLTHPSSSSLLPAPQKSTSPIGVPNELLGDLPLRLIIVGHNPSDVAWQRGHYYANPSNWMWRILKDTNLAPSTIISGCNEDFKMPGSIGIGFTDVGSGTPGTDSNKFKAKHFEEWRQPFFDRLAAQMKRASEHGVENCTCGLCGAPVVFAFSGKKQFSDLFQTPTGRGSGMKRKNTSSTSTTVLENTTSSYDSSIIINSESIRMQAVRPTFIPLGKQAILPLGWPLPLEKTEVWVMTSTSGAAAMTKEARYAPWKALAERLEREPWPLNNKASCGT